jgi:hypothetical protein
MPVPPAKAGEAISRPQVVVAAERPRGNIRRMALFLESGWVLIAGD